MKKNIRSLTTTLLFSLLLINVVGCSSKDATTNQQSAKTTQENSNSTKNTTTASNTISSNQSTELKVEKAILGKKDKATDKITPVSTPVFKQGETIAFVFVNVGKFKKGSDGKNKFDLDMELKEANGKLVGAKKGLLGEGGHVALPNDIAKTPYASLDTSVTKLKPGEYTMNLRIRDIVGGGNASESVNFKIQ